MPFDKEIEANYVRTRDTISDINEHIPTLRSLASECTSVLALGVRTGVSNWAFITGLLDNVKENVRSRVAFVDVEPFNIDEELHLTENRIEILAAQCNDLELDLGDITFDLTFIDTWHVYGQLRRELDKFAPLTTKYLVMHDTTVDGVYGESVRCGWDINKQAVETGISAAEIARGLWPAVEEFLEAHPEWKLKKRYVNNNGLTILERTSI
ncbi:hypothetical protein PBCVMA1D_554R [Paramecium bursaria Chlorella virus MA1D]|nr:hypothetical protein PBCVMA1D_554R [Paramecium bursaria Chlorella virus MA1D]